MTPRGRNINRVLPERATYEQRQIAFEYKFFLGARGKQDGCKKAGKVRMRFCLNFRWKFQTDRSEAGREVVRPLTATMILIRDIAACQIPKRGYGGCTRGRQPDKAESRFERRLQCDQLISDASEPRQRLAGRLFLPEDVF